MEKVIHVKKGFPYVWAVERYTQVGTDRLIESVALYSTWEKAKKYADIEGGLLESIGNDLAGMQQFKKNTLLIDGSEKNHNLSYCTTYRWVSMGIWKEYTICVTEYKIY